MKPAASRFQQARQPATTLFGNRFSAIRWFGACVHWMPVEPLRTPRYTPQSPGFHENLPRTKFWCPTHGVKCPIAISFYPTKFRPAVRRLHLTQSRPNSRLIVADADKLFHIQHVMATQKPYAYPIVSNGLLAPVSASAGSLGKCCVFSSEALKWGGVLAWIPTSLSEFEHVLMTNRFSWCSVSPCENSPIPIAWAVK